ncbi:2-C-methyl-D-erythritol 4-phosphate cytidylyltransferase [Pseudacidovorax intermedius]|uniref:2-C-methyl-D-erythritol 4-phosphate cytidylyltransferase n=1 Tax=Pseudacidovorax intermedius TaxID=433924 RepID=A0A147H7P9_9BURK|nr:2-C-methyl-D-erythritol 4-phosphate cytidylyltransferase [Pseudacidovorax intermedius]KTT25968.1 2-C-methyl-D-erythritol 4-phosphate cytidylyltransferase [Pseudacidovorax intermedius]
MSQPPPPRLFVLIPCAGTGSRAGAPGPKQYEPLAGRPLVAHTLDVFRALGPRLAGIALVVAPDDQRLAEVLPGFPAPGEWLLRAGGATRAQSVAQGLAALREEAGALPTDWVLVHDAARCLLLPSQVDALIGACVHDPVGGLLALPLPDTLKAATPDGRVAATVARADKWLAQTPQMFRIGLLQEALARMGDAVTDEASAIEGLGLAPRLVPGTASNFKVTFPDDFALAAAVLQARHAAADR